jgi:hypothetical protein
MKFIFILFLCFLCLNVPAQKNKLKKNTAPHQTISFPKSFLGNWKGEMTWFPNGKPSQKIPVALRIQALDSVKKYSWEIIYGAKSNDIRAYVLMAKDSINGHWVIDELNGILLDSYWLGNRFSGAFAVQGNTILDSYWLENGLLHFEFFSYPQQPQSITGNNTEESPKVDVYRIGSYQKGLLKRQ